MARRGSAVIQTKKREEQAVKMATQTLTEKTYSLTFIYVLTIYFN
jgi:hypothetical protein